MVDIGYLKNETKKSLKGVTLERIYKEKKNIPADGRRKTPALRECLEALKEGDTLHVGSIDDLSTDLVGLKRIIALLEDNKNTVFSHEENLELSRDGLEVLRVAISFEEKAQKNRLPNLNKIKKRQKPEHYTVEIDKAIRRIESGVPKSVIAKELGVSRQTLYSWLKVREKALKKEALKN
jgi:DNA invertase Pin-like site-specific DNA recombinase